MSWVPTRTILEIPGGLLPATLVISAHPMGGQTLDEIAQDLAESAGPAASPEVRIFDLPAGRTARVERLRNAPDGAGHGSCPWSSST